MKLITSAPFTNSRSPASEPWVPIESLDERNSHAAKATKTSTRMKRTGNLSVAWIPQASRTRFEREFEESRTRKESERAKRRLRFIKGQEFGQRADVEMCWEAYRLANLLVRIIYIMLNHMLGARTIEVLFFSCEESNVALLAMAPQTCVVLLCMTLFAINMASATAWMIVNTIISTRRVASFGSIQNFGGYLAGSVAPVVTGFSVQHSGSFSAFVISAAVASVSALAYFVLLKAPVAEPQNKAAPA